MATVVPQVGIDSAALLRAGGHSFPHEVVPGLASEIASVEAEVILALDDYQVIDHPAINDAMTSLLKFGPRNLRLAISSRTRPHLPIGRLRVRGELTELGPDELGFTEGSD